MALIRNIKSKNHCIKLNFVSISQLLNICLNFKLDTIYGKWYKDKTIVPSNLLDVNQYLIMEFR